MTFSLQSLEQIAAAAGHGHSHLGIGKRPVPWFTLEDNVRPEYDLHFVRTFDPPTVRDLITRLIKAEEALEQIASCEVRADGDVVDVARKALA